MAEKKNGIRELIEKHKFLGFFKFECPPEEKQKIQTENGETPPGSDSPADAADKKDAAEPSGKTGERGNQENVSA